MKKILAYICAIAIIVSTPILVACKNDSPQNFSTETVQSNGGTIVVVGEYMYYINGVEDRTNTNRDIYTSAIFRVKIDKDKNPIETPQKLVSNIAGFENGSIFVFGDYLYYATPNNGRDNKGDITNHLTSFYRIKTDGTEKSSLIYTTKKDNSASSTASDGEEGEDALVSTLEYTYYIHEQNLYLLVYEDETLSSIKIDKKTKAKIIDTEVNQVVFSEKQGQGSEVDKYVYYSKTPLETETIQTGHKIYRVLPDGEEITLISSGKDVALLQIKNNNLYFSLDDIIYASNSASSLSTQTAVSYATFTYFILLSDGGVAGVVGEKTYYYNWSSGSLVSYEIYDKAVKFVAEHNKILYFIQGTYLYKINPYNKDATAVKVSTAVISDNLGSYLNVEFLGNKVYFMTREIIVNDSGEEVNIYHLSYVRTDIIEEEGNTAERMSSLL